MSNQLTCKDPFGYKPGLEDGNSLGPSPLSNSNGKTWISPTEVIKISRSITIDSVFASFSLNQQGGNYSSSGYLYEIWIDGFVNNQEDGNILSGGWWLYLTNLLTLDVYDLLIVDTQDVNDPTEGNITKVLVADPAYSKSLSDYVSAIQLGEQPKSYSVSSTPLLEYANRGIFPLENNIVRRINFNTKDPSLIINKPLLSYTTGQSLWIDSPESVLDYPQLKEGNSLRLQKFDNDEDGFEVIISSAPTYRGQVNDTTSNTNLNLSQIRIGNKITLELSTPYQFNYKKGDFVYVSQSLIDVKSGNFGTEYIKAVVTGFENGFLELMVSFRPLGSSASGINWYVISEVDQINIPISSNPYFLALTDQERLEYNVLNSIISIRLQIEENNRFNRYVFRYKPDNSSSWRYVETTEINTIVNNVLPNTVFLEEIMGFNDSTGDYCGFSSTGTFNTFF